jgi:hypothetical protein
MPHRVSRRPSAKAIGWSLFGAVVGLWLSYAVVAGMTQTTKAAPVAHARDASEAAPVSLALTAAPALQVRSTLFTGAQAVTIVKPRHKTHRATKRVRRTVMRPAAPAAPAMTAPAPPPQTTMSNPVQDTTPATPVRSTPAPRPQPKPVAKVSSPATPDFDDSAPSGFDNSG